MYQPHCRSHRSKRATGSSQLLLSLLAALSNCLNPLPAWSSPQLDAVKALCSAGHFYTAKALFDRLPSAEKEDGEAYYVAGQIYAYLNQPDAAYTSFQKASEKQFSGYDTWGFTQSRLQSLVTLKALTPPFYRSYSTNGSSMTLYAKATPWTVAVNNKFPDFMKYAQNYFGYSLPAITFYFFDNHAAFAQFHKLLLHAEIPQSWHDGTGNYNVVLFCEVDRNGAMTRPTTALRTYGDVLHEYTHALCATIYGDGYLEKVPQWFNEGIADAVAAPYYSELYSYADRYVREQARLRQPPTYTALCSHLYEDHDIGYAIARLMVREVLGQNLQAQVGKRILQNAAHSNFDSAITTVTGIAPTEAYRRVIARYWPQR